ncbi:hypothetical protein ABVF61_00375 [Roseibium sp. HPY-6]|uniref:hypothetical protein n=1 Tax=Roseibium sp. HPY-6 TaxID=3229852 RepID=UPI00338ED5BD
MSRLERDLVNNLSIQLARSGRGFFGGFGGSNPVTGGGLAETLMQTSMLARGETLSFDQSMPVVVDALGRPAVVASQNFNFTAFSTPSAIEAGFWAHGAMLNPFLSDAGSQGFDEAYGDVLADWKTATALTYDHAQNDDMAVSGPLSILAGTNNVIAKQKRLQGYTLGDLPTWNTTEDIIPFTVLAEVPPAGFICPGICNPDQTLRNISSLTLSPLRNEPQPVDGSVSYATLITYLDSIVPGYLGVGGEKQRRMVNDPASDDGYVGTYGLARSAALYALHSSAFTDEQKRQIIYRLIPIALDVLATFQKGMLYAAGAGQWHGYHNILRHVAWVMNDDEMAAACQTIKSNMQDHPDWIRIEDRGMAVDFPAPKGQLFRNRVTFHNSHIGKPHWSEKSRGASQPRYFDISGAVRTVELEPDLMLGPGPGGLTGLQHFLNGPNDQTNPRASAPGFKDRYRTMYRIGVDFRQWFIDIGAERFDASKYIVDANWPATYGHVPWTGPPEIIDPIHGTVSPPDFFFGGDGSISWDVSLAALGVTYSSLPITEYRVRYSRDGYQWHEIAGQSDIGTVAVPPKGVQLFCQIKAVNSAGEGDWSFNFRSSEQQSETVEYRNRVTTTGTDSGATPVNFVPPAIVCREFPAYLGSQFVEVGAEMPDDNAVLFAGEGLWNAFPYPNFTRQWYRNSSELLTDETGEWYIPLAVDNGSLVDCLITDPVSVVSMRTNQVLIPAPAPLPADVYFDSDFQSGFPRRYPLAFDSITVGGGVFDHRRLEQFQEVLEEGEAPLGVETTYGSIACDKTGQRPWIAINLCADKQLVPGDYRLVADFPMSFGPSVNQAFRRDLTWKLGETLNGTEYGSGAIPPPASYEDRHTARLTHDFTVPPGALTGDLYLYLFLDESTGSSVYGDPQCSKALVTKIG